MPLSNTASARWKRRNKEYVREQLNVWLKNNSKHRALWTVDYLAKTKQYRKKRDADRNLRPKTLAQIARKKAYMQRWIKNNHSYTSIARAKRRAMLCASLVGNIAVIRIWINAWRQRDYVTCFWCLGQFLPAECHADHMNPLIKGGTHSVENLCISCAPCNRHKHDKTIEEWNKTLSQPILL